MTIDSKHPLYDVNKKHYEYGELLVGGTIAMREASSLTIPREQRETDENYTARVNRSVLFNAYNHTLEGMSMRPFTEKVEFDKELPEKWRWLLDDIDGAGMSIDTFCYKAVRGMLHRGKYLAMVNMPSLIRDGKKVSVTQQKELNLHPFVSLIHPDSLIYWLNDDKGFTKIKLQYSIYEEVDDEIELVEYIDVWTREEIVTYKQDAKSWAEIKRIENSIGVIPLVVCDDINDSPVLEDLAHLNVSHFRKTSDSDNSIHMYRVPFLHFAGWSPEDVEATVSVNNAYVSEDADSKITWVQTASSADSMQDIEMLENRMSVYGFDLVTEGKMQKTATEVITDSDSDLSMLQSVVKSVEGSFEQILYFAGLWENEVPPETTVNIFKDFNITAQVAKKVEQLLKIRQSGEMSRLTFLRLLDRLKVYGDSFDIDEEIDLIEVGQGSEL